MREQGSQMVGATGTRVRVSAAPSETVAPSDLAFRGVCPRLRAVGAAPLEVRLDEAVEVAVEHGVDVAGLVAGALVLDQPVRRQRVRADLAAERDVAFVAGETFQLLRTVLALSLIHISEPTRLG